MIRFAAPRVHPNEGLIVVGKRGRKKISRPAAVDAGPPTLQERLEASPNGRAALSAVLLFVLAAIIVSNLPASALRRSAHPIVQPFLDATGLNQNWNLFAPNPRRSTLRLEARIDYADGSTSVWRTPISDPFVGTYRAFRWRKWAGYVVSDSRPQLWPMAALWLARTHTRDGKVPVRISLYRQWFYAPKPGSGDSLQPPWREELVYTTRYQVTR